MFFNESVILKQKYSTENIYLKVAQKRLIAIIEQKDEQLIQKDTMMAIRDRIAANNLQGLQQQLKVQKKQKNRTIGILSISLVGVLIGLGYSLAQ